MYKLIINLKTYKESTGERAFIIAKAMKKLQKRAAKKNVELILCPHIQDIAMLAKFKIPMYAQHVDTRDPGQTTGFIVPENLKELGVTGSLINHSEHRLTDTEIQKRVDKLRELGMQGCVCAKTPADAVKKTKFHPDMIAIEPPELIGSKTASISSAHPELIEETTQVITDIPILVGAGVKSTEDVQTGIKLGAMGFLVASDVAKAKDPYKELVGLLDGF